MTTEFFLRKIDSEEYFNKPGFVLETINRINPYSFDRKEFLEGVLRDIQKIVVSEVGDGARDLRVSSIMNNMKNTFVKHTENKKVFLCFYLFRS